MRPSIMVFEKVIGDNIVERKEYRDDSSSMDDKAIARNAQPDKAFGTVRFFFLCRLEIGKGTKQRADKRENYKKMT